MYNSGEASMHLVKAIFSGDEFDAPLRDQATKEMRARHDGGWAGFFPSSGGQQLLQMRRPKLSDERLP